MQTTDPIQLVSRTCTACGKCVRTCAFLKEEGDPQALATTFLNGAGYSKALGCSLCGLCTAVCPFGADPAAMFLAARKQYAKNAGDLSKFRKILGYEDVGVSPGFSLYAIPEGCDTVLFPGCSMPGGRPETVWRLFSHLQAAIPRLGIVLDCCTVSSRNLGLAKRFETLFGDLKNRLVAKGVTTVLTTCPNCHLVFSRHGAPLVARTVYEVLVETPVFAPTPLLQEVTVHDACVMRHGTATQDAVRSLCLRQGLSITEMTHSRKKTLCCGEGAGLPMARPELAEAWRKQRLSEAGNQPVITYCSGCSRRLDGPHVLDIVFRPEVFLTGKKRQGKPAPPPLTYLHRLWLKQRFRRIFSKPDCTTRLPAIAKAGKEARNGN